MHLACRPGEPSVRLLLLMGIWHMLLLHLLLCCCSGTDCCSHIICSWSVFNICQKPKDTCKLFCSGMEANAFSFTWKMCRCTRIIKCHTLCYHKKILLGRILKSDLDWHRGLVNWGFSIDPDGFSMRPRQRNWHSFKWSLMNNKGISKAAATAHVQSCLSQDSSFTGDKPMEKKKDKKWGGKRECDNSTINITKI